MIVFWIHPVKWRESSFYIDNAVAIRDFVIYSSKRFHLLAPAFKLVKFLVGESGLKIRLILLFIVGGGFNINLFTE